MLSKIPEISTRDLLGLGVRWDVVWGYFMEEAAFEIDLRAGSFKGYRRKGVRKEQIAQVVQRKGKCGLRRRMSKSSWVIGTFFRDKEGKIAQLRSQGLILHGMHSHSGF